MDNLARQHILAVFIIILLISCVFSPFCNFPIQHARAAGWWNGDWSYYKTITIDDAYIDATLTNFPILVSIDDATGDKCKDAGEDIRFLLPDNSTELNYEIEKWVDNEDRIVWVNVTTVDSGSPTIILMYYGNSGASDNQNPSDVWDGNYKLVCHMNSTTATVYDSTVNDHDGTKKADVEPVQTTGKIGYGQDYDNLDDVITWGNIGDTFWGFSVWIKPAAIINKESAIGEFFGVDGYNLYGVFGASTGLLVDETFCLQKALSGDTRNGITADITADWNLFSVSWDDSEFQIYLDGVNLTEIKSGNTPQQTITNLLLGKYGTAAVQDMDLDEFRVSIGKRNDSWIKAIYHSENQTTGFLTFGSEQEQLVNTAPTQSGESPTNSSTGISLTPNLHVLCNDADNDNMNATWWSNSSGDWVQFASNSSASGFANNTNITQSFTNASVYNTIYYWSLNLTDGTDWTNNTYHFTTEPINTSVDDISPYNITSSPLTINATGDSSLDNVTLWYRYSTDNSSWPQVKKITINSSKINEPLTNFPILFHNTSSDFASHAQSDGDDFVFVDATNTTQYNHEIESYNSTTGELIAWVNVTSVSSTTDTILYLYYGNATCSSQENSAGTWDRNYTGVWHFSETPGVDSYAYDSTSNDNNGSFIDMDSSNQVSGKIGGGLTFNGSSERVETASIAHGIGAGNFTYESWVWRISDTGQSYQGVMSNDDFAPAMCVEVGGSSKWGGYWGGDISANAAFPIGSWQHIVMVRRSGTIYLYNQSVEDANSYSIGTSMSNALMRFGSTSAVSTNHANVNITDARFSNVARNDSWIEATYNSTNNPTTFLSVGGSEERWMQWSGTNPDEDSPWSWEFDFPNSTGYYEFYSIGKKSGSTDEAAPNSADARCYYRGNTAPEISNPYPSNGSIDIGVNPTLNITVNDTHGDIMTITWYSNSSESWQVFGINTSCSNGTYYQTNSNFSAYSTTYYWSVNITDGVDWSNATYHFTTEADTIVFTLISMTPSDILLNSTGNAVLVYNISTSDTGLNATSIFMAHLMNSTGASDPDCQLNTSYILEEEDWLGDKYGSGSRAEDYWFEMFNQSGTGELGWKGQWRVKNDSLTAGFVVNSFNSTWYNFTITVPLEDSFGRIMMGSPQLMRTEDKTGQVFDVYRDNIVKVAYNMSNTCFWENNQHNNTNYGFHINAVPSASTTKPLRIYFANGSYTGNPQTSPYTELIGQINPGDPYSISPINSNYYHISFSTNETGYVGTVKMDENFSFIFETSQANIGAKWNIPYADDIHDHGPHIHNFNSTNCSYLSTDDGDTWTKTNGTIDTFIAYAKLDSTDEILFKAYAQMNGTATGDGSWSTTYTELIDEGNFAPNNPDVVVPNGTAPTDSYNVGDTINITYNWLGDPNHETCWVNITAYNNVSDTIAYYLQNRSITDIETHVNNTWWYDWDTTGVALGTYYINITATDPDSNMSWGRQNGTFILVNNPPTLSGESPTNESTNIAVTPSLYVVCTDANSDTMTATWRSNSSGAWVDFATNTSISTGTNITQPNSNFSAYNTTYYWSINLTDGYNWTNATYHFTTNVLPVLSGESPTNSSTGVSLTPALYVICTDADNDVMTATWRSNSSGDWIDFATNTSISTGTNITQPNSNFSAYNTTYYWSVNLTDGTDWVNATYHFTTNVLPVLSGESPTNSSTGISLTPGLYVVCTDADSDVMIATWRSNSSGAWIDFATNTSISTGTNITQPNSNFSAYNTTYYWSINLTDGADWVNETYHFTTNVLPVLSGESPTNSSTGVSLTPSLHVVCTDADNDVMTVTWRSNSSGAWVDFATNTSISTGTNITQDNNNFSAYSTTYYWSVNLTDGIDWVNETYHFTTAANNPPVFSNEVPANESTGVAKTITTVNVTIVDPDGDTFNWTIETSPDVGSDSANDESDGSKSCSVSGLVCGTTYTWYVNCTDGTDWTNETYHFTTNYVPTQSDEIPVDGYTGASLFPVLSVTVADNDASNLMNITFYSNVSGSWSQIGVVIENRSNGAYHQRFDEFGVYGELYWWNCSVSDGTDSVSSSVFSFTAEDEPVISLNYGTIKVYGTEYTQGEPGTAYAQVFHANGTTANAANVYVTVWERVNKYIDNQQMIYIEGSNGCYHYNFTTPSNISVFMMDVNSSNPTAYGSGEFHVSEWASAIPNINETVSDINDTVNYMNDTLNYLNGTYLPALETKIDNIYTLLQTLNIDDLSVLVSSLHSILNDTYNISYYLNNTVWAGYVASQLYDISNMTYNVTGYINATVGSINTTVNAINSTVDTMITIVTSMDANITLIDITVNAINDTVGYINLTTAYLNSSSMFAMNDTLASINDTVNLLSAEVGNVNKTAGYMNLTVDFINVTRWGNFTAYDLYNVSNMTYWLVDAIENIVLHINTTTVAIGSWDWFEVRLTEFGEITPGDDYLAQITVFDKNGEMANADLAPTISLYDSAGNLVVTGISMTWIATGQYVYSYTTAGGQPSGQWTTITRTTVSGHVVKNIIYWELESNPPEVTLTVVDNVFPSISAEISITNEGTGAQEYIYYWWITPRADGDLVNIDTVDSGSASKLIASLDTFTTIKILNVPTLGTYWYKVRVYWGTEWSAASAQFIATGVVTPAPGGAPSVVERYIITIICVDDRYNRIPGVKLDLFEDVRFLGSELTNETGVAVFSIPKSMVLSITAAKDGYETVVRSISVSGSMTEVIQMHKIAFAELPWLILMIIIIIGGIILYCIYRKQTAGVKKKRTRSS